MAFFSPKRWHGVFWMITLVVLPTTVIAATSIFTISMTLRKPATLSISNRNDPQVTETLLEVLEAHALDVLELSHFTDPNAVPLTAIILTNDQAQTPAGNVAPVKAFYQQKKENGKTRHLMGGFIPKNVELQIGIYRADAVVQVLFQ